MGNGKKQRIIGQIVAWSLILLLNYIVYFIILAPLQDSIDLYWEIKTSDSLSEAKAVMLDGYEANFKKQDYRFIQDSITDRVMQFSLFEYYDRTFVIFTAPGENKIKVLSVDKLPKEARDYFLDVNP